ncbi:MULTISPECIES: LysE family translocator [unclassified Micromonospora]|uniref:LysE family translocator n=1 Tax=unclassified Micromonospora TaxID=2617518 RepID=UPI00332C016C
MVLHLLAAAGVLGLLTLVPGPDMAVVTRRALVGGRSEALRAGVGVVCGLLVWGSLAVLGLTALLTASPGAYLVVKVVGVAYLLFLGFQALRRGKDDSAVASAAPTKGRPFLTGLATNLLNPKIAVFYTALLPTLAPPSLGAWGLGALVLIHAVLTLGWLSGYAYALNRARALLERPRVRRALDRVTGVVLIAFAVRLATERA